MLEQRLHDIVRGTPSLMVALRAVRSQGLPAWCIGAGALRARVWDVLHHYPAPSEVPDMDVAYFDPAHTRPEDESTLQQRLSTRLPHVPWEVTNQARVHHWYGPDASGQPAAPLSSLSEGLATWPEYATAVGVWLDADEQLHTIAPHGLDDLMHMVVRHNPLRASRAVYLERLASKQFQQRWPQVRVRL